MKAYRVSGTFEMGMNRRQPFAVECAVKNEDAAREHVWSEIGSRHGIGRRMIQIKAVEEIPGDDAHDPRVRRRAGEGA
jgi:ribosomal protein L20A (L18A)